GRRAIVLNPDLVGDDIDVDHCSMHATRSIPAHMHQLKVVVLWVDNGFCGDIAMRRPVLCIVENESAHNLAILVYGTHFGSQCLDDRLMMHIIAGHDPAPAPSTLRP